jgi:hypothetical protein
MPGAAGQINSENLYFIPIKKKYDKNIKTDELEVNDIGYYGREKDER